MPSTPGQHALDSVACDAAPWVQLLARLGYAAKGIVYMIIGWFLIQAALQYDPQEAQGLAGARKTLQGQAYGPYVLAAVALGLIAHGLFQLAKARYRLIRAR